MIVGDLERVLLEELDVAGRPELRRGADISWPNGRAISGINAALFLHSLPIAYFSRFSEINPDEILQLHKDVWSQSKAPLLFITLPHEIRIYNGYEPTPKPGENLDSPSRLLQHLTNLTDRLTAQQEIRKQLVEKNHYERVYLETGAFWDTTDGRKIKYENRADKQLIESMGEMRRLLHAAGLSNHIAYTLLGRSIFIRYLEDRGVLTPDWIEEMTGLHLRSYAEILPDRQLTYLLFERLSDHFNGDLFPVEDAERDVDAPHLKILLDFLSKTSLKTGQLSLWPYNFEYIPIELISNIYDKFLDDQRVSGAYYTPLPLADFILEETMGDEAIHPEMTVLDPACGSGVFLVGAYRRLIQAWRRKNGQPEAQDLCRILQNNIFGVDKHPEAVPIAAFSLYLEILNHLSNEQIRDHGFQFPPVLGKNLLKSDFFSEQISEHFIIRKFDRVIGNMPWGRGTLTDKAEKWLSDKKFAIGGKQAAPAFMLRVPEFCKPNGEIALLAPTKGTILVTNKKHQKFREEFFARYHVRAIVNFSAIRHELFLKAISPSAAVFYTPNSPASDTKLIYGVPKPSALSRHLKAIVLDTTQIKFLDRTELAANPHLWKIAMWGTSRDAALIERLKSFPQLGIQIQQRDWKMSEGIQIGGGDKNPAPWLENMPLLLTNRFRAYVVDMSTCNQISQKSFHRPRTQVTINAPLVLIRRSLSEAAFSDKNLAYLEKISGIVGIAGQENVLKWLTAYLNSSLVQYYHFLTSTTWGVERENINQWEYEQMPCIIPDEDNSNFKQILHHFDEIADLLRQNDEFYFITQCQEKIRQHKNAIDKLVFELYNLHPVEQQLVYDMIDHGIEFFQWSTHKNRKPRGARPVQPPDVNMLETYAEVFKRTATSLLKIKNQTVNATVYKNGALLTVVSFDLIDLDDEQPVQVVKKPDAMRKKLQALDKLLLERKTPSMYMRRHIRIYDGKRLSLIRPGEQRFWTQSQARTDADAFLAEISS
jgi:hypothetical protein